MANDGLRFPMSSTFFHVCAKTYTGRRETTIQCRRRRSPACGLGAHARGRRVGPPTGQLPIAHRLTFLPLPPPTYHIACAEAKPETAACVCRDAANPAAGRERAAPRIALKA